MLNSIGYIGIRRARLDLLRTELFMDPASSPPWIYLFNILSAGACRSSTSSCCCALEYSISRFRRCATRASWSARTSTRASCRSSFSFASHFLQLCRHAGRREGFLGTPPLAPRPAFSPFSLLPPPSLPSLPPLPRAWMWVGVGWEGGREEITLELINVSSTSRSLNALSTLARRSLDARSTSSRRHCGRGDDG